MISGLEKLWNFRGHGKIKIIGLFYQVTRAEVEEDTFAIKRELAAIKQHDIETSNQLESAKDRIRKLSEIVERSSPSNVEEEVSLN